MKAVMLGWAIGMLLHVVLTPRTRRASTTGSYARLCAVWPIAWLAFFCDLLGKVCIWVCRKIGGYDDT